MRILLTGSTGFLGSALAHYWAAHKHQLCLLVRPSSDVKRIQTLLPHVQLERVANAEESFRVVRDFAPDAIVHTACSYGRKGETSLDVMEANLRFGAVLLQAVLDGVPQVAGATTFLNTGTVLAPDVSLYALSKTQFSSWGAELATQSPDRLRFIDIRLQQMYGPGDDRSKFSTHVIEACRQNEAHLALTAGEQRRDFIHIDDVVRAYDRVLDRHADFGASDAIEVGSGEAVTMRSFVELAKQLAGASTTLEFGAVPYRTNEAMLCVADTARLRGLGWRPEVSLTDGLNSMLAVPR